MDNIGRKVKIIPHFKPILGKEEEEAILGVVRSGQIAQRLNFIEFEKVVSDYIGKKYAVAVNPGLSALHLLLIGLEIKERGIMCTRSVLQPIRNLLKLDSDKYPNAEKLANEVISLPLYPSLSLHDVDFIVNNFLEVLGGSK